MGGEVDISLEGLSTYPAHLGFPRHFKVEGSLWITALNPQMILLNVGFADRRGLPSSETLDTIQGYPLLRTDRNGWIHITTDGERMWVEVEKR